MLSLWNRLKQSYGFSKILDYLWILTEPCNSQRNNNLFVMFHNGIYKLTWQIMLCFDHILPNFIPLIPVFLSKCFLQHSLSFSAEWVRVFLVNKQCRLVVVWRPSRTSWRSSYRRSTSLPTGSWSRQGSGSTSTAWWSVWRRKSCPLSPWFWRTCWNSPKPRSCTTSYLSWISWSWNLR